MIFPYLSLDWTAYWETLASASNINTKCCLGRESHDAAPYTRALEALQDRYEQPRQLIWSELDAIFSAPALRMGDATAFESFAMSIQCFVRMLTTLEGKNKIELNCSSHVDCLLSKIYLAPHLPSCFIRRCLQDGILQAGTGRGYTLQHLATWLQMESEVEKICSQIAELYRADTFQPPR